MKKSGVLFLMLVGPFNLYAQNADITSPAENFANRKETILEKRFDEVGKISTVNIQVEYLSDLSNSDKMQCIRFDIQPPNNAPGTSSTLLDSTEANGLISFLKYISDKVISNIPTNPNTEISVTDKYNFQIGCYWQKNSGWILYLRTDAENPETEADISQPNIAAFLKLLTLAKSEIQMK